MCLGGPKLPSVLQHIVRPGLLIPLRVEREMGKYGVDWRAGKSQQEEEKRINRVIKEEGGQRGKKIESSRSEG